MNQTWTTIGGLVAWLDDQSGADGDTARLMRVLKVYEEIGEVAQEVEGAVNGVAPWQDVHKEICDVLVTGMVALARYLLGVLVDRGSWSPVRA